MTCKFILTESPVGKLKLVAKGNSLAAVLWENESSNRVRLGDMQEDPTHPVLLETARQLREYFEGTRKVFELPLDFIGTPFQKKVWSALLTIPFGETRSYGQIASQIGQPKAVRAVGGANNRNPVAIIAPCHRVIGASGKLVGYAGGLDAKNVLLTIESP